MELTWSALAHNVGWHGQGIKWRTRVTLSTKHAGRHTRNPINNSAAVGWTVYLLCKIMMGVIKRRRLLKSNEAVNEMESITPQTQQPITHTNKEGFQEPRPNNDQGTIATKTTGTMKTTSTDAKPGTDGTSAIVHCTQNNIERLQQLLTTLKRSLLTR